MEEKDAARLQNLMNKGELHVLAEELKPFLAEGDLDARYLNCLFSIDPDESGDDLDSRKITELKMLALKWHRPSLLDLAWAYRYGDDVERDSGKFLQLMTAAAFLGDEQAKRHVAEFIELETDNAGLCAALGVTEE
ncbi:hypothetical protein [Halocynthiibacter styelae]|uniref:Uncharacterized protein n=1 Tax=Halocynthiibacter styelae TaxID=2761955 RepID=A0A8J7J5D3_9RHOB|nr:hypothetical protein [Paenihalocynthiibacter styelae]MBI1493680.1 hypothetical protein [Paenihalocynthiibacter styelae]